MMPLAALGAQAVLPRGWERVAIPGVGTIDVPPTMEVKAGFLKKLRQAADHRLNEVVGGTSETNLVLQQKGLNTFTPGSDETYVRVLVATSYGRAGEFASLSEPLDATHRELNQALDAVKREVEGAGAKAYGDAQAAAAKEILKMSDAEFREFLKYVLVSRGRRSEHIDSISVAELRRLRQTMVQTMSGASSIMKRPKILEWLPAKLVWVNGTQAILIAYRRQLGSNPPVLVRRYTFQNHDRMHYLTLSYREVEGSRWRGTLNQVLDSFRISDARSEGRRAR
jgi:hypothetical protein